MHVGTRRWEGFILGQLAEYFSHGLTLQLKPVSVVHEPVQNGVGESVVADTGVPLVGWELADHQGRRLTLTGSSASGRFCIVRVAVTPRLAGLVGLNNRMPRLGGMLRGVLVLRIVAAADVPAGEAETQIDPGCRPFRRTFRRHRAS